MCLTSQKLSKNIWYIWAGVWFIVVYFSKAEHDSWSISLAFWNVIFSWVYICTLHKRIYCGGFWGYPPTTSDDYPYYRFILDPKSKQDKVKVTKFKKIAKISIFLILKKKKLHTGHTFWSWLIRCVNMKWIKQVLLKIQSGHDSVHRRTDGGRDRQTRWNQYTPFQLCWSGGCYYGLIFPGWTGRPFEQDRRWNADKPSAALDPYIPTWSTISPANHRPANFWFDFFFLHSKEIVKSGATSCPTDEHQLQIWNSHSLTLSSTNNHQNYLLG